MKRKFLVASVLLIAVISICTVFAIFASAGDELLPAYQIVLAPGSDETERGINWLSPFSEAGEVQYAEVGEHRELFPTEYETATATSRAATYKTGFHSNKATMTGILPSTEYVYRIVCGNYVSDLYYFSTGTPDSYEFVFLGDPQFSIEKYALEWQDTLAKVREYFNAEFIISAGDQVNNPTAEEEYELFVIKALAEIPFAPSAGTTHDAPSESYGDHFYIPNPSSNYGVNETTSDYWYTYGDVLFMHLNMTKNSKSALESEHKQFITEAMAQNADAKWNIVVMHHSLFSAGSHSDPEYKYYESEIKKFREALAPQLTELGIDIVLSGHDHVYVRSHLMNGLEVSDDVVESNSVTDPEGTLYIASSSSTGSKFYDSTVPDAYYSAYQNDEHRKSAIAFTVTDGAITLKAYFLDTMEVFDSFTVFKGNHIHSMTKIEAKKNSCFEDGHNEYWYCDSCRRYFADEEGSVGTTPENEVIPMREHDFAFATCTEPATCKYEDCGEQVGESRGHRFSDPTCTEPATCKRDGCDATDGEPLGHIDEDGNGKCDECREVMELPPPDEPTEDEPTEDEPTEDAPTVPVEPDTPTEDEPQDSPTIPVEPDGDEPTDTPDTDGPTEDEPQDSPTAPVEPEEPTDTPDTDEPTEQEPIIPDEPTSEKVETGGENGGADSVSATTVIIIVGVSVAAVGGIGAAVFFLKKKRT